MKQIPIAWKSGVEIATPVCALVRNDNFGILAILTALPWLVPASDPALGLPKYTYTTAMTVRYPSGFT